MEVPEQTTLDFNNCPVCGSTEKLAESAANYMKEKGWASEGFHFCIQFVGGMPIDKPLENKIPMGSVIPEIAAFTDICLNCGNVYATRIVRGAKQKAPTIITPGPSRN